MFLRLVDGNETAVRPSQRRYHFVVFNGAQLLRRHFLRRAPVQYDGFVFFHLVAASVSEKAKNKNNVTVSKFMARPSHGEQWRWAEPAHVYPLRYFLMKRFEAFSSFLDSDGAENCLKNPENFCLNDGMSAAIPFAEIVIGEYQWFIVTRPRRRLARPDNTIWCSVAVFRSE